MQNMSFALLVGVVTLLCCSSFALRDHEDLVTRLPGQPGLVSYKQYAGYVAIDHTSQLFYYFVEAEIDPLSKPLVLWLTGSDFSCSSVGQGAFTEHGPFRPKGNGLVRNYYSWNKEANMLYLDSPVGVGFSYSSNDANITDAITARDNLLFLEKWMAKHPQFNNRDLFIAGDSYAGHFVPQLANLVLKSSLGSSLKGILIGNPFLDFETDLNSTPVYLWSHGLISDSTLELYNTVCSSTKMWREFKHDRRALSPDCLRVANATYSDIGDLVDMYDISLSMCKVGNRGKIDVCIEGELMGYLNREDVQRALHARIGRQWLICTKSVKYEMHDAEVSSLGTVGELVKSGIRVLMYSGDQDADVPFMGTRKLVGKLAKQLGLEKTRPYGCWVHAKEALQVGGWTEEYGHNLLSFATIQGAGKAAAFTQPQKGLALFTMFVQGKPLPHCPA